MSIKTFWIVLVKIIGLWLLRGIFYVIPQFFSSSLVGFISTEYSITFIAWLGTLIATSVYIILALLLIFKAKWVVDILKLESQIDDELISTQLKTSSILAIAIVIIGGIAIVDSVPEIVRNIITSSGSRSSSFEGTSVYLFSNTLQLIIGVAFVSFFKPIANFIKLKIIDENESVDDKF